MKKVLAFGVASVCALSIMGGVFATEVTTVGDTPIEVAYTVGESFKVTIPASFDFAGPTTAKEITVEANDVYIQTGKALKVVMTSSEGALVNLDSKIPYSITLDGATESIVKEKQYDVLNVAASAENLKGSNTLTLTPQGISQVTLAGRHADTLTFSVSVGSAAKYAMLSAPSTFGDKITSTDDKLSFRSEASYDTFDHVEVDGVVVDPSNYSTESGSTVVNFNATYALNLSTGMHNVKIFAKDNGYAEANFEKTGTKRGVITFTIDGTQYKASENMTWAEWVMSYGSSASENGIVWFNGSGASADVRMYNNHDADLQLNGVNQKVSTSIIENAQYERDHNAPD